MRPGDEKPDLERMTRSGRAERGAAPPDTAVGSAVDARVAAAARLLRERGMAHARVSAAGRQGEIAAIEVNGARANALAAVAPELKALGFLYVAVDLARVVDGPAASAADPDGAGAGHADPGAPTADPSLGEAARSSAGPRGVGGSREHGHQPGLP